MTFRRSRPHPLVSLLLALLAVLAFGCGEDRSPSAPPDEFEPSPNAAPDFSLRDVNPNSATANALVSPRDYLRTISAWYFGHAT